MTTRAQDLSRESAMRELHRVGLVGGRRTEQVAALWHAGWEKDYAAIGAALGISPSTVQVYASQAGLLRESVAPRRQVLRLRLPPGLRTEAARRGMSSADLAQRILDLVVQDDLYDAVLDDRD